MVDPIGSYAGLSISRSSGVGSIQAPSSAKVQKSGGTDFGPAYQVQLSAEAQAASSIAPAETDFAGNINAHANEILSALDGDYGKALQVEWDKLH